MKMVNWTIIETGKLNESKLEIVEGVSRPRVNESLSMWKITFVQPGDNPVVGVGPLLGEVDNFKSKYEKIVDFKYYNVRYEF